CSKHPASASTTQRGHTDSRRSGAVSPTTTTTAATAATPGTSCCFGPCRSKQWPCGRFSTFSGVRRSSSSSSSSTCSCDRKIGNTSNDSNATASERTRGSFFCT
ncbi:unnamed protein product, partial [Pylaiella littoralis]